MPQPPRPDHADSGADSIMTDNTSLYASSTPVDASLASIATNTETPTPTGSGTLTSFYDQSFLPNSFDTNGNGDSHDQFASPSREHDAHSEDEDNAHPDGPAVPSAPHSPNTATPVPPAACQGTSAGALAHDYTPAVKRAIEMDAVCKTAAFRLVRQYAPDLLSFLGDKEQLRGMTEVPAGFLDKCEDMGITSIEASMAMYDEWSEKDVQVVPSLYYDRF